MLDIKFYLDENISNAVLKGLRTRGMDVVSVTEIGMRTKTDIAHIRKALELGRVIVTFDDDFVKLHYAGEEHAGIAFFDDSRTSIGDVIRSLELLYQVLDTEYMHNHVEFL